MYFPVVVRPRTDAPTVVSLANHAYFNLAGEGSGSVDDPHLTLDADTFLPIDEASIPLGFAADVAAGALEFRAGARLRDRVRDPHEQVRTAAGLDHAFTINGSGLRRAARLRHPPSGRWLEVHTDQPSLQVYTGNAFDGSLVGTGGRAHRQGDGIALEAQRHPVAPHHDWLPSAVLRPGGTYRSCTEWRFGSD